MKFRAVNFLILVVSFCGIPQIQVFAQDCPTGQQPALIHGMGNTGVTGYTCVASPNSSNKSKSSSVNMANDPCEKDYAQAVQDCRPGGTASQMAMMAQMGAGGMTMGMGSAYAACKAMQMQSMVAMGGGAMVFAACTKSIDSCQSACDVLKSSSAQNNALSTLPGCSCAGGGKPAAGTPDKCASVCAAYNNNTSQCKSLKTGVDVQAGMAAMQGVMGMISASQCEALVSAQENGQCTGPNANSFTCNPAVACAQNPSTPGCPANLAAICGNPQTAAGNPMCPNNSALSAALPSLPNDPTSGDTQGALWNGYQASNQNPQGAGGDGGGPGGGLPMGGGGGYPGGPNAAPGPGYQGGGLKSDIGGGVGGGSGGGSVTMGNPTNGTSGGGKGSGIDLSQFLPGGAIAANRALASVNNGITGANELSNFEKITRMMNQKRKYLAP